jgi:group I intron endonuclease
MQGDKSNVVYLITLCNGKQYVGQTTKSLSARVNEHLRSRYLIGKALRKYKEFTVSILFESKDQGQLLQKEREFIAKLGTQYPGGYNLTAGGEGVSGLQVTETTRQKQSLSAKKRWRNPEQRRQLMAHLSEHNSSKQKREQCRQMTQDPAVRKKMPESAKLVWARRRAANA